MQKVKLYSSVRIYVFAIALSFLLSAFIFNMSNEPASVSADRSGGIADILAPIFVGDLEELDENEKATVISNIDHIIRKIAHFCMYAALGALFTFASLWHTRTWLAHAFYAFLFGTLYATSDEIHQAFVPGRGPLASDVILDSIGVLSGTVFVLACAGFWIGYNRRKS